MGNQRAPRWVKNAYPKRVWMVDRLGWGWMGLSGSRDDARAGSGATIVLAWACATVWLMRLCGQARGPRHRPEAGRLLFIDSWLGRLEDVEAVVKMADARHPLPRGKHTTPTSPTLDQRAASCRSLAYRLPSGTHSIGVTRCPTSLPLKSAFPARCRSACLSPPPPSPAALSPWPPYVSPF